MAGLAPTVNQLEFLANSFPRDKFSTLLVFDFFNIRKNLKIWHFFLDNFSFVH